MARSTGPILAAGTITLVNQTVLGKEALASEENLNRTVRIGVSTGLLAGGFYGLEKLSPNLAVGLAWTMLVTVLFVRFGKEKTPLERVVDLL